MTKWLERREKVLHHTNYIRWHSCLTSDPLTHILSTPPTLSPSSPRVLLSHLECKYTIKMTNFPSLKGVSFKKLSDMYGASLFETALIRFIGHFTYPTLTTAYFEEQLHSISLPFRSVPFYHKIRFLNRDLHGSTTLDAIHTHPKRGGDHSSGRFDTALIRVRDIDDADQRSPIDGLFYFSDSL